MSTSHTKEDELRYEALVQLERSPLDFASFQDALKFMPGGDGVISWHEPHYDGCQGTYSAGIAGEPPCTFNHTRLVSAVLAVHMHVRFMREYGEELARRKAS